RFPEYYVRMFQIRLTKNDGVINLGNLEPEEITVDFAMDCAPASRIVRVVGKLSPRLGEVSTRSCREGSTIVRHRRFVYLRHCVGERATKASLNSIGSRIISNVEHL